MNRALFKLLILNRKAAFRRTLRGVKTVRGAFLLLFSSGLVALMIGSQVVFSMTLSGRPEMRQIPGAAAPFAPFALLGFTLLIAFTSAGEAGVYFTPAEVDLLFSAPFTRRELLFYRLGKSALDLVVISAVFSLMMWSSFRSWPAGFLGLVLSLALIQLVSMITALAGQIVAESVYTRARKAALLAIAIVMLAGLAEALRRAEAQGFSQLVANLRDSAIVGVLLAPFEVFTRVTFAEKWFPDLAGWAAAALAIDAALLMVVLKLDANYLEAAATISQKVFERIRRSKQGGGVAMPVGARAGRLRLPPLPRMAGAGPLAWRQLLLAMRTSRHILIMSLAIGGVFAAGFALSPRGGAADGVPPLSPMISIGMVFYLTFIFAMQLPWAFRGDVDHIDFLKTLPVHPAIVAAGELAGGVLLLTAIQLVVFALLTAAAPSSWPIMLPTAAFCLPINGLLMSLNNLLFLIYPVRHPAGTTFDFQMMGKMMLFMMLQVLLLIPLLGIPAGLGGAAYFLAGYSWAAFAITIWLVLLAELLPLVLAVAWAFQRFDVSTETPA